MSLGLVPCGFGARCGQAIDEDMITSSAEISLQSLQASLMHFVGSIGTIASGSTAISMPS